MELIDRTEIINEDGIKCKFAWDIEPKTWGGFKQDELKMLANQLSDFYGISHKDRTKITIHFGDHNPFIYLDGHQETVMAKHISTVDVSEDGKETIASSDIILNRSLELAKE